MAGMGWWWELILQLRLRPREVSDPLESDIEEAEPDIHLGSGCSEYRAAKSTFLLLSDVDSDLGSPICS